jgi:membrane protein
MGKLFSSRPARVVKSLAKQYFEDSVGRAAAELAYYLLFSIFPLAIVINSLVSRMHLDAQAILESLGSVLPAQVAEVFSNYLDYINGEQSTGLLTTGLVMTIYMWARSMRSLMASGTRAYRIERPKTAHVLLSFGLRLVRVVSILILLVAFMASGALLDRLGRYAVLSPEVIVLARWLSYIIAPVWLFFVLAIFYDVVGGRRYRFRWACPGAAFFVGSWTAATMSFSWYVGSVAGYSALSGSLGAMMILMVWLYITAMLLIMGGVFNRALAEALGRDPGEPEESDK